MTRIDPDLARAAAGTTAITRDNVGPLLDHGAQVRCFSGSDRSHTTAQGRLVAYTDRPTLLVVDETTGERTWWVADIAEVLSVPTLRSHELPALPPNPAKHDSAEARALALEEAARDLTLRTDGIRGRADAVHWLRNRAAAIRAGESR